MNISVIIPAYNVEKYIQRSINSVLNQTVKPSEIIVIDDGSTDNTANLIKEYGDKVVYYFKENGGECSARNYGIEKAKGDWIAWLDSDDEWIDTHLENFMVALSKKSDLMWYGAPANSYDEHSGKLLHAYKKHPVNKLIADCYFHDYLNALPPYAFFSADTFVIRKEVFKKVGSFDVTKKTGGDIDMWFRIGLHYPEIGFNHTPAANIYRRDSSVSFSTNKTFSTAFQRIIDCEESAKKLGENYLARAKPRLNYWLWKLAKSAIAKKDVHALKAIRKRYYHKLPPKFKLSLFAFTTFPVSLKVVEILK